GSRSDRKEGEINRSRCWWAEFRLVWSLPSYVSAFPLCNACATYGDRRSPERRDAPPERGARGRLRGCQVGLVSASLVRGKKVGPQAEEIRRSHGQVGSLSVGLEPFPLRVEMCSCLYATIMPESIFLHLHARPMPKKRVWERSCVQLLQISPACP